MKAIFANGCFWCTEAVYLRLEGVKKVTPIYIGGSKITAKYTIVSLGITKHVEAILVEYDEKIINYELLLEIFWKSHDSTSKNKQGNDKGPQYASMIYYFNDKQKNKAIESKKQIEKLLGTVHTKILKAKDYYIAEEYHHAYYDNNINQPYCTYVIEPKLQKLRDYFKDENKLQKK